MLISKCEKHTYFCEQVLEILQQTLAMLVQLMVQSHAA